MIRSQIYRLAAAIGLSLTTAFACNVDVKASSPATIRGLITDSHGKPIPGATVLLNKYEGPPLVPIGPSATADKAGRYELQLEVKEPMTVKEIWVSHPGFVRIIHTNRFLLKPRQEVSLDFELRPGEVISGTVEPSKSGRSLQNRIFMLRVTDDKFNQIHVTGPDGRFELYVHQGEYAIDVMNFPDVAFGPKKIRAGTRDVVLKPQPVEMSEEALATAFDKLWVSMDFSYSYFAYKPDVDWNRLREIYRPRAIACQSVSEFLDVLKEMLSQLHDLHVWIETDQGLIGTHAKPWQRNWNPQAIASTWASSQQCGKFAIVGKTKDDGFGFVVINKQSEATDENVQQAVAAIAELHDVPGFIVDLRGGASGGSETLALQLAGAFCDREIVYAKHKRRNGRDHNSFGEVMSRRLPPGEKPFTGPVVCLIGQRCMSSGEALVQMMQVLPHVTVLGMTTRGSSGNPQPVELPGLNARVYYSRWVDMLPDGDVFEGRGIAPDIEVNLPIEAYATSDPTWERGLEVLRKRIAGERR